MKIKLFLILFCVSLSSLMAQSIVVNDPNDPETNFSAEELIQEVLVSGSTCVDISLTNLAENPDGVNDVSQRSWGYFRKGDTDFPFDEGIILSTGFAVTAEGPNDSGGTSDIGTGWDGDIDIKTLLDNEYGSDIITNNATVFEFTFTSSLPEITFDFIFASEEYEDDFECTDTFRDGFGFLIKGPGIPDDSGAPFGGVNVGQVPGSANVPVSTASIHREAMAGDVELPCAGQVLNVDFFPDLYVSNDAGNTDNVPIEFDGLTATLVTASLDILPNEEYTVKLVIADRGDSSFDSAVFLRAGSFDIGNVDLGDDILLDGGAAVCEEEIFTLDAGDNGDATYRWFKDGIEIPNETNNTLDITTTGLYGVEITIGQGDCIITDEILVEFFPLPEFELGEDQIICGGETTTLDATVTNPDELDNIMYKWFRDGVEIAGETNSTLVVSTTGLYGAEVTGNGCTVEDEVNVELVEFTVDIGDMVEPCGDASFEIIPIIEGADSTDATYEWSTGETSPTITVAEDGTYSVTVTISGCMVSDDVIINFRALPVVDLGETIIKCAQDAVILSAIPANVDEGAVTYTWFLGGGVIPGETSSTLEAFDAGLYTVEVSDEGCVGTASLDIEFYANENCVITQGISPNGDNSNDQLDLEFLNDKSGIEKLSVYNRLGTLVYEKTNYINEWAGQTTDGVELPVGTYFYVITLQAENPITGWIYLNK